MIATFTAILSASLLGSLHCAGMCGPFCAVATTTPVTVRGQALSTSGAVVVRPARLSVVLPLAYNLGRLTTYVALGAAAGALGSAVDLGGSTLGLQRLAASLAGLVMITFGVVGVARVAGYTGLQPRMPAGLGRLIGVGHSYAARWGPVARATIIGLLTTLLPCGWLYAFVVTAAGAGSPLGGAAVMLTFWLGTLPVMFALGVGLQFSLEPLRRYVPLFTAIALIAIGILMLAGRISQIPGEFASVYSSAAPVCH